MARRRLASALSAVLAAFSGGCTTIARIEAPSIKGDPKSSGVVVVQPEITVIAAIFGIRTSADPVSGVIARVDGTSQVVQGGGSSGFVIFPDLPPGRWQVVMIEGKWQSGSSTTWMKYGVPVDQADEFTVDVRAGEPVFIRAKIDDDRHVGSFGVHFSRRDDPKAEREAWKWMGDVYEKSAWEPVFRAKLGAPEPHAEPASAPKSGG